MATMRVAKPEEEDKPRTSSAMAWAAGMARPDVAPGASPAAAPPRMSVAAPGSATTPAAAPPSITRGADWDALREAGADPNAQVAAWTAPEGQQPVTSSRFVSLGQMMGLNAEKAQALAQRLASRVQGQARSSRAALAKAKDEFGRETSSAMGRAGLFRPGQTNVVAPGASASAPGAITPGEARARAAQAYAGPSGLSGLSELEAQAEGAQRDAGLLGDTAGVDALAEGGLFDAALAQGAGGDTFRDLRKRYAGLLGDVSAARDEATNRAASAGQKVDSSRRSYLGAAEEAEALAELERKRKQDLASLAGKAITPNVTLSSLPGTQHIF